MWQVYASSYPEIITAAVGGPELVDGKEVFTFKTAVGRKRNERPLPSLLALVAGGGQAACQILSARLLVLGVASSFTRLIFRFTFFAACPGLMPRYFSGSTCDSEKSISGPQVRSSSINRVN